MRRKGKTLFIISFLSPAVLCFLFIFLYPTARTMFMSLFHVDSVTDDMNTWVFKGFENFVSLFRSKLFLRSMVNSLKIWLIGGAVVLSLATLFSVVINSGVKAKNFWRSVVYLPHIINVVALVTMWVQYAFNPRYGFFKIVFEKLGLDALAAFQWTSPDHSFLSMMIAYIYGSVGFYVLILVAGMDSLSKEYFEAADIEGASKSTQFFKITMPLIKDIYKRCIVLYSAGAMGFFAYSSLFSTSTEMATVVPLIYMYDNVFGRQVISTVELNVGAGAAVGVIIMLMVLFVNWILDRLIPSDLDTKEAKQERVRYQS